MRRILTVLLKTDQDVSEPTGADLARIIGHGDYTELVVLDCLVPSISDLRDAQAILEGTKTVDTRPTAARPDPVSSFVGEALQEIALDAGSQA
jgi:hypothetical protein